MDHEIVKKQIELAHEDLPLGEKLDRAAGMLVEAFPFDQCLVYTWVDERSSFVLAGSAGSTQSRLESYAEDKGLPGAAKSRKRAIEVSEGKGLTPEDDPGLKGFASARAVPLKEGGRLVGVLYLKSKDRGRLGDREAGLVEAAAAGIVNIIRCSSLMESRKSLKDDFIKTRNRLVEAEKLMALGDMAATLAHEIKSPMVSIGGLAARVKKKLSEDSPLKGCVDSLVQEVGKLEKVMNGMMRFLQDSTPELELDGINRILEETLGIFASDIEDKDISVERDLGRGRLEVMADREQLKIAFDNIISNAIQSMAKTGRGGTMRLSTRLEDDTVVVEFSDTGGGIAPENLESIFNPFFTTKEGGTGLGLAITNSIVMRHGGSIDIENNYGTGVTFRVRLPRA